MSTCTHQNTKFKKTSSGSAMVIAMIVLAILGALGIAALDVADLNIFMAANDRDSKDAFFHADSGVNVGHEFLEESISSMNSTFFSPTSDATTWSNSTSFNAPDYPLTIYASGTQGTYVRSGTIDRGIMEGSAMQIGAGYEGAGKSAAHGGTYTDALIRAHREGQRNSRAEVDLGWRHIN